MLFLYFRKPLLIHSVWLSAKWATRRDDETTLQHDTYIVTIQPTCDDTTTSTTCDPDNYTATTQCNLRPWSLTTTTDNAKAAASNPYRQRWAAISQPAMDPYRQRWAADRQPEASRQAATRQDKTRQDKTRQDNNNTHTHACPPSRQQDDTRTRTQLLNERQDETTRQHYKMILILR